MRFHKATLIPTIQYNCDLIYKNLEQSRKVKYLVELGGTQILETVRYFIIYHGINNYYGILINTFIYPVKYSNNFSQVTSV